MEGLIAIILLSIILTGIFTTWAVGRFAYQRGLKEGHVQGYKQASGAMLQEVLQGRRPLSFKLYEDNCFITWTMGDRFPGTLAGFVHLVHKIAGEAGELSEHWGKAIRDDEETYQGFVNGKLVLTKERRDHLLKELGDVLWYVAMIARELGSSLIEVAMLNIAKLADRRKRNVIQGSGDNR